MRTIGKLQISGLVLLISGCMMQTQTTYEPAVLSNYPAIAAQGVTACMTAMDAANDADALTALDPENIGLLVWNIHKNEHAGASDDLARMTGDMDLVLLQEANSDQFQRHRLQHSNYWSFAPGFRTAESLTGVMTISSARPLAHCFMRDQEPWLLTPKAISVTKFALRSSHQTLAVVNIHGVNFTIGVAKFEQQLEKIHLVIGNHDGPVIVAGDFNSWNDARVERIERLSAQLGLTELTFAVDNRVTPFSHTIDRIFVRGLLVLDARTEVVNSSDHNPLLVRLAMPADI